MSDGGNTLTVVIPLAVKPRGGRKAIITPGVMEVESRHDITLIKAVARGFRWLRMLETGKFGTITELAAAEKISTMLSVMPASISGKMTAKGERG